MSLCQRMRCPNLIQLTTISRFDVTRSVVPACCLMSLCARSQTALLRWGHRTLSSLKREQAEWIPSRFRAIRAELTVDPSHGEGRCAAIGEPKRLFARIGNE